MTDLLLPPPALLNLMIYLRRLRGQLMTAMEQHPLDRPMLVTPMPVAVLMTLESTRLVRESRGPL